MTGKERERLGVLCKRRDHLLKRIRDTDKDLSWDKHEAAALSWAIEFITGALESEGDGAHE